MNAQNRKRVSGEAAGKKTFKSNGGKRSWSRLHVAAAQTEKPGGQVQPKTRPLKGGTLKLFPIVGVGASAGGLEAFTQLLQNLPVDTDMAFVLVQPLDPDHGSARPLLLARTTSMPVSEVTNGMAVAPNRVYVIPPNTNMIIARGILQLQSREKTTGAHRPIDFFFASRLKIKSRKQVSLEDVSGESVSK